MWLIDAAKISNPGIGNDTINDTTNGTINDTDQVTDHDTPTPNLAKIPGQKSGGWLGLSVTVRLVGLLDLPDSTTKSGFNGVRGNAQSRRSIPKELSALRSIAG